MEQTYGKARAAAHTCAARNIRYGTHLNTVEIKIIQDRFKDGVFQFIYMPNSLCLRVLTTNFIRFEVLVRTDVHIFIDTRTEYGTFLLVKEGR